jgi:hypothetical protein
MPRRRGVSQAAVVIQIICLVSFFATLVIGSLIADAFGRLPNAEELQEQDRERFARYERAL